jgi:methylglyoxal synthase
VEAKIRESDLTLIITGTDGALISRSVILTVNMKTVQMLTTPGEQDLKNTVQAGKIDITRDV